MHDVDHLGRMHFINLTNDMDNNTLRYFTFTIQSFMNLLLLGEYNILHGLSPYPLLFQAPYQCKRKFGPFQ